MTANPSFAAEAGLEADLLRLWNKLLKRSDLTIDDDFFESGGDSLLATELIGEVERLTGRAIPPSAIFEAGTVRRLVERLGRQERLTPQLAVRIGGKKGRLFHFFHGDFDAGGVSVPKFAAMLGPDRPILAIAPHGMAGERVPASIEEMAADRLPVILEAQPRGPYALGGHCNGALVAFETARLLVKAGHRVDLVVMMDPVSVSVDRMTWLRLLALDLSKRAAGVTPEERQGAVQLAWLRLAKIDEGTRLRRLHRGEEPREKQWWDPIAGFLGTSEAGSAESTVEVPAGSELLGIYARAMSVYCPSRLAVPILYFALSYSGDAWRRVSPEIELIDAPGDHLSLNTESAASLIARMRARLDVLDASTE